MELFDLHAFTADRRAAREREATLERLRPRRERPAAPAKPKPVRYLAGRSSSSTSA